MKNINLSLRSITNNWAAESLITSDLDELAPMPARHSFDSGQRIPRLDSCQLTIKCMSINKLNTCFRLPYQLENVTFHIGFPVVQTDGWTGVWTAYSHLTTKISQMHR